MDKDNINFEIKLNELILAYQDYKEAQNILSDIQRYKLTQTPMYLKVESRDWKITVTDALELAQSKFDKAKEKYMKLRKPFYKEVN
jgi:hypothetical protein